MYICVKCKKEMRCKKNGIIVRYGESHCYASDKYKCPSCGNEILACNTNNFQCIKEIKEESLFQMD